MSKKSAARNLTSEVAWLALCQLPWTTEKLNTLLLQVHRRCSQPLVFFEIAEDEWRHTFGLNDAESQEVKQTQSHWPEFVSLAAELKQLDIRLIPAGSSDYPGVLAHNLGPKAMPSLLYSRGDAALLHQPMVGLVGSRNATRVALRFTQNIAQRCVAHGRVVVSGFARGVDKAAFGATLACGGRSVIVLPQGILDFGHLRSLTHDIERGKMVVVSAYHPQAKWSARLALQRNTYIYALSQEVYIAQSGATGGAWQGAFDGLHRGRGVCVFAEGRMQSAAHDLLVLAGAVPVDATGEPIASYENRLWRQIEELLAAHPMSAAEIKNKLRLHVDERQLSKILGASQALITRPGKSGARLFALRREQATQAELFGSGQHK